MAISNTLMLAHLLANGVNHFMNPHHRISSRRCECCADANQLANRGMNNLAKAEQRILFWGFREEFIAAWEKKRESQIGITDYLLGKRT